MHRLPQLAYPRVGHRYLFLLRLLTNPMRYDASNPKENLSFDIIEINPVENPKYFHSAKSTLGFITNPKEYSQKK